MMTSPLLSILILSAAVLITLALSVVAYWRQRGDGYSHMDSLTSSSVLVVLLVGNAAIGYAVNIANFY